MAKRYRKEIGNRLRAERQNLSLTQAELAAYMEISQPTQVGYESGTRAPSADYLAQLHERGFDVFYILTGNRSAPLTTHEWITLVARTCARVIRLATAQHQKLTDDAAARVTTYTLVRSGQLNLGDSDINDILASMSAAEGEERP